MTERLRIYVAGPYTAETAEGKLENTQSAIDAGLSLFKMGHFPFIPHLTHFVDERAQERGVPMEWAEYIIWDLEWLEVCDGFLHLASSEGADMELQAAEKRGLQVFQSIDEVPDVGPHDFASIQKDRRAE